jgi:predicted NBD/HSP70 family sugar kinase
LLVNGLTKCLQKYIHFDTMKSTKRYPIPTPQETPMETFTDTVRRNTQEAAYLAVGVGVLGAQSARARAAQGVRQARERLETLGAEVRDRVEPVVTAISDQVEPLLGQISARVEPLVGELEAKARTVAATGVSRARKTLGRTDAAPGTTLSD